MFDFLHCFIDWLVRENGYQPADRSAGVLWIVSGALFLESSDSVQLCWWLVEGCHVQGPPRRKRTMGVRGLGWEAYVSCWSGFSL
jgi:hypothetical protein